MGLFCRQDGNASGGRRLSWLPACGSAAKEPVRPRPGRWRRRVAGVAGAGETVQAIDDAYNRQLLHLEQQRLEQLGLLAARQKPAEAAATYERLFRLAIAGDLFRDAESAAVKVVEQGTPSPTTDALAHLVKIIAEVDRGAFEQSLQSLRKSIAESTQEKQATEARAALAPAELIGICEAYYQRLVEGNQFAIAREAFRLALEQPYNPAVKDFLASRLKRIELVGKPAPLIQGTDLDGKAFNLAEEKGKVVLVIFWASWNLPAASQVSWLEQVQEAHHKRGLQRREHQPRCPRGQRPEAGNGPAQYPPVLARLQHHLAHPGEWLRRSRLRQGLRNLGYPGQCPDRPRRVGCSDRSLAQEPRTGRLPAARASEQVTRRPKLKARVRGRGELGGIGRGRE